MNVLINAITITEGGGVVVLSRLLDAMHQQDPKIIWYIAAGEKVLACLPKTVKIIHVPYSWARKSPLHLLFWYEIELPNLIKKVKADVCFSQTNFLPRRRLACPSLLLIHNAGFFSDAFTKLHLSYYTSHKDAFLWKRKNKWAYDSIKRATAVTVQTQTLADKIVAHLNFKAKKITTIPHGLGLLENREDVEREFPNPAVWRIGYVTKFGVQKDFSTAIKAISLLKKSGIPVKLILTLDIKLRENLAIFKQIQQYDVEDYVENRGDITDADEIKKIYASLHLFIFPSIIESFGFTLVEAMASGLPIIAADTDSNQEVLGNTGNFFQVGNETELLDRIYYYMRNQDAYQIASKNSLEKSKQFCWQKTAESFLNLLYKVFNKNFSTV